MAFHCLAAIIKLAMPQPRHAREIVSVPHIACTAENPRFEHPLSTRGRGDAVTRAPKIRGEARAATANAAAPDAAPIPSVPAVFGKVIMPIRRSVTDQLRPGEVTRPNARDSGGGSGVPRSFLRF